MPARVDFYILNQTDESAGWKFACKLAEKAYRHKQRMFIYCNDQPAAHRMDELLWTFDDISFVPHLLQGEQSKYPPPIHIGYEAPQQAYSILLNLTQHIPAFYNRYARVMEIVFGDETARQITRERFKQYRADECDMHTHQMDHH